MTMSFDLHHSMAKNIQSLLLQAVTLDEQKKHALAVSAYAKAINSLMTYLSTFSPTSVTFKNLAADEKDIVRERIDKYSGYLSNARERRKTLSPLVSATSPASDVFKSSCATPSARNANGAGSTQPVAIAARPSYHPSNVTKSHVASRNNNSAVAAARGYNQVRRMTSAPMPIGQAGNAPKQDPLREAIESEILDSSPNVQWDDIYGLEDVKDTLIEMVVLPAKRPDLYSGLRAPGRGILLYGPPGTGKSLIAKAVATNMQATFFSISASSLNSKYHGESERLVRMLFAVARERQPSFIFLDEVDSVLGARRGDGEHEASRRLKTEFMCQFDGVGTDSSGSGNSDRIYVMAASNRPQDLDDAVRRRLDRRIYVPLPDKEGRMAFLQKLTSRDDAVKWNLSDSDILSLAKSTARFSGSDLKALCREASLMPLRELGHRVSDVRVEDVRASDFHDFEQALQVVRPSANENLIRDIEEWNKSFGSKSMYKRVTPSRPRVKVSNHTPRSSHAAESDDDDDDDDDGDSSVDDRKDAKPHRSKKPVGKAAAAVIGLMNNVTGRPPKQGATSSRLRRRDSDP